MNSLKQSLALVDKIKKINPLLLNINSETELEQALLLMESLLEDYDNNIGLIELLSNTIAHYEENAPEYAEFNESISERDKGVSLLSVLMDQHNLKQSDFESEIGKKSLVSQILSGKKNLTKQHIAALSQRFNINPAMFF